jgi:hypothetical protein
MSLRQASEEHEKRINRSKKVYCKIKSQNLHVMDLSSTLLLLSWHEATPNSKRAKSHDTRGESQDGTPVQEDGEKHVSVSLRATASWRNDDERRISCVA